MPRMTATENVALPLLYAGFSRKERIAKAKKALQQVELPHRADHKPAELSGGECQRVAIARAIVNNPSIILADEPTGNLDQNVGREIISIFQRMNKDYGVTLVMVTHDQAVAKLAQRQVNIIDGKISSDQKLGNE